MSPRKLSDSDRQEMLTLYRQTEETTSSLATRFGVSSSTVSRFLKSSLTEAEYEELIQAKRLARTSRGNDKQKQKEEKTTTKSKSKSTKKTNKDKSITGKKPKAKTKSTKAKSQEETSIDKDLQEQKETPVLSEDRPKPEIKETKTEEAVAEPETEVVETSEVIQAELNTVAVEVSPETENNLDEDDDDEEDLESLQEVAAMFGEDMDDGMDDEDDEIENTTIVEQQLEVLSLDEASFPRICYFVIDRYSELVTKPMKEFAHLGLIPESESFQKTLPIFDNHKVAKRFCVRKGKVIKVPDGRVLQKTSDYLQAKGINRILMDGKIYSL